MKNNIINFIFIILTATIGYVCVIYKMFPIAFFGFCTLFFIYANLTAPTIEDNENTNGDGCVITPKNNDKPYKSKINENDESDYNEVYYDNTLNN